MDQLPADAMDFAKVLWPDVTFYGKQREIIYSVRDNDETFVPAGNMLGKDFVAGFIALWFFLSRHPCRIVTTSADYSQLEAVLWGEIRRFIQTAAYPLASDNGGPLVVNHLHLRKVVGGAMCGISYMMGRVSAKGEGMLGHHVAETGDGIPRTLFIADEASGVDDVSYTRADTWAKRKLVIGNPYPCTNFFKAGVKGGDQYAKRRHSASGDDILPVAAGGGSAVHAVPAVGDVPDDSRVGPPGDGDGSDGGGGGGNGAGGGDWPPPTPEGRPKLRGPARRCYRKVIKIKAEDSPNVRAGLLYRRYGREPLGDVLLPGVLPWDDYVKRRDTWDPIRQCIGLDAEFWEGAEVLLYPPQWLNRAEELHRTLVGLPRRGKAVGVDPGEGVSHTVWTVVDELGIIEQTSIVTPDTSVIVGHTKAIATVWGVPPEGVVFDRGGGGKQVADLMRSQGWNVRTVAFGESPSPEMHRGMTLFGEKKERHELTKTYKTRRAEMYGILREKLDPSLNPAGFALPPQYAELRRQLALLPLLYDGEGCLYLPPKNGKPGQTTTSLSAILGRSPDEADSLVLAVYGMSRKAYRPKAGVMT